MNITRLPAKVACHSLVGVDDAAWPNHPVEFGNYFHFSLGPKYWPENYCVNMWSENLRAWAEGTGAHDIEVAIFDNGAMRLGSDGVEYREPTFAYVTDERVPKEWLIPQKMYAKEGHSGLVFTGCMWCPKPTQDEIVSFHQDKINQSLQLTER